VFVTHLPPGCRAEQTVQGTIELDRLENVVFMPRPAAAQGMSNATVFRLDRNGTALRVPVSYGKASVSHIEVVDGLKPGDVVILSDPSRWEDADALSIE